MVKNQVTKPFGSGLNKVNLNKMIKQFVLILVVITSISQVFSQTKLPKDIEKELKQFNGTILVKHKDQIIINQNYKVNNLITSPDELHELGEVSQTIIAEFINQLALQNQINLKQSVSTYLQQFPYDSITVEQLINHTSGLPSNYVKLFHRAYYNNPANKAEGKLIRFDNYDILTLLENKKPKLNFSPGTKFEFNNLNYIILTLLIERVTYTPINVFSDKYFKYNSFSFHPTVIFDTDSFANKSLGLQIINNELFPLDNIHHLQFPYIDGTVGHQHFYLTNNQLGLWGTYLLNKININEISKKPSLFKDGFFWKNNYIYSKGMFCGHTTYLSLNKSNYVIVITSNLKSDIDYDLIINKLNEWTLSLKNN